MMEGMVTFLRASCLTIAALALGCLAPVGRTKAAPMAGAAVCPMAVGCSGTPSAVGCSGTPSAGKTEILGTEHSMPQAEPPEVEWYNKEWERVQQEVEKLRKALAE
jgi:hypothetical protein